MEYNSFGVMVGNPQITNIEDIYIYTLPEFVQKTFPYKTENMVLIWNAIPILINYSEQLNKLIPSIVDMILILNQSENGRHALSWEVEDMTVNWDFYWINSKLKIEANWLQVSGKLESLLNKRPCVSLHKNRFLAEWKMLFTKLQEAIALNKKNISTEDMSLIKQIEESIKYYGYYYK